MAQPRILLDNPTGSGKPEILARLPTSGKVLFLFTTSLGPGLYSTDCTEAGTRMLLLLPLNISVASQVSAVTLTNQAEAFVAVSNLLGQTTIYITDGDLVSTMLITEDHGHNVYFNYCRCVTDCFRHFKPKCHFSTWNDPYSCCLWRRSGTFFFPSP